MPRFSVKMKVSEKPDTEPYTLYYPHSVPVSSRNWTQDYYQLVSIDPATKTLLFVSRDVIIMVGLLPLPLIRFLSKTKIRVL